MVQDRKRNEIVYPARVVAQSGNVTQTENLFIKKELVVTFNETRVASLEKRDETHTWLVLDFGKELHGGVRMIIPHVEKGTAKLRLVFGESVSEALSSIGEKGATNDHAPRDIEVLVSNFSALEFGQTGFRFVKIELMDTDNVVAFKNIVAVNRLYQNERRTFKHHFGYCYLHLLFEYARRSDLGWCQTGSIGLVGGFEHRNFNPWIHVWRGDSAYQKFAGYFAKNDA